MPADTLQAIHRHYPQTNTAGRPGNGWSVFVENASLPLSASQQRQAAETQKAQRHRLGNDGDVHVVNKSDRLPVITRYLRARPNGEQEVVPGVKLKILDIELVQTEELLFRLGHCLGKGLAVQQVHRIVVRSIRTRDHNVRDCTGRQLVDHSAKILPTHQRNHQRFA